MKALAIIAAVAALGAAPALAQNGNTNTWNAVGQAAATIVQTTTIPSKQRIETTGAAFAPALAAAGVHSCAGSTSAGFGGSGLGLSFGSTWEMEECNRRAYAATLAGMGQPLAALELVCQNAEVRAALNNTGVLCPSQRNVHQAALAAQVVTESQVGGPRALRAAGCRLVPNSHWECPNGVPR